MNTDLHDDGIFTVVIIMRIDTSTPALKIRALCVFPTIHVPCRVCLGAWGMENERKGVASSLSTFSAITMKCAARETLCGPATSEWDDVRRSELILSPS